ncbi:MAG: sigma-54-dependent transcriptional regulator, partial [Microvirga sp.]
MSGTILVVDDDPVQRRLLEAMVRRFGYEPVLAETGEAGLSLLRSPDGARIDVVILDLVMPNLDGLGVLAKLRESAIETPVIVQTAHGSIETVVQAMRAGAIDFVVKPVGAERLQVSIKNAMRVDSLEDEIRRMRRRASGTLSFKDLATASPDMTRVIRLAERAAKSNIPVLIEGESGVGKEVLARAIQGSSDRKGKAFVTVNCGAIPDNLVESILFGHEKGAFTGATERHVGKFVEASGGTLFLDEIGDMPSGAQAKLLRFLQTRSYQPLGGVGARTLDVRVLAATTRAAPEPGGQGLRSDLAGRLGAEPLVIPPLRHRPEDLGTLVAAFLGPPGSRRLEGAAFAALLAHSWPQNVRELEKVIRQAALFAEGAEVVRLEHLPLRLRGAAAAAARAGDNRETV